MKKPQKPRLTAAAVSKLAQLAGFAEANAECSDEGPHKDDVLAAVDWVSRLCQWYHATHPDAPVVRLRGKG